MANEKPDPLRPIEDARGSFMLPQGPLDSGYYTYGRMDGKPDRGGYQYPHPMMMTAILRIGLEWQAVDKRRFGVGNISRADGRDDADHATHLNGLQVDIRPLRLDGLEAPVAWMDRQYDHLATAKLIALFRTLTPVKKILYNDPCIPYIWPAAHHDDHFHVSLLG